MAMTGEPRHRCRAMRRKVVAMNPGDAGRQPGMARRQATVLESVEEIRAQIRGMAAQEEPIDAPVLVTSGPGRTRRHRGLPAHAAAFDGIAARAR